METLKRLQKLLDRIGGEKGLERLETGESDIILVRHAGWIRRVWEAYENTLEELGAYEISDSVSGFGPLCDIHLPFEVVLSESDALLELRNLALKAGLGFHIDADTSNGLNDTIHNSGGCVVSLYDTKSLFEKRVEYLKWEDAHPYSDESFEFWRSQVPGRHCRRDRKDLVPALRADSSRNASVEGLLNFAVKWFPLILDDALGQKLFPRFGTGERHLNFEVSVSIGIIEMNKRLCLDFRCVDAQRGFLKENNAIVLFA